MLVYPWVRRTIGFFGIIIFLFGIWLASSGIKSSGIIKSDAPDLLLIINVFVFILPGLCLIVWWLRAAFDAWMARAIDEADEMPKRRKKRKYHPDRVEEYNS
jgi:hypothetical protein